MSVNSVLTVVGWFIRSSRVCKAFGLFLTLHSCLVLPWKSNFINKTILTRCFLKHVKMSLFCMLRQVTLEHLVVASYVMFLFYSCIYLSIQSSETITKGKRVHTAGNTHTHIKTELQFVCVNVLSFLPHFQQSPSAQVDSSGSPPRASHACYKWLYLKLTFISVSWNGTYAVVLHILLMIFRLMFNRDTVFREI